MCNKKMNDEILFFHALDEASTQKQMTKSQNYHFLQYFFLTIIKKEKRYYPIVNVTFPAVFSSALSVWADVVIAS